MDAGLNVALVRLEVGLATLAYGDSVGSRAGVMQVRERRSAQIFRMERLRNGKWNLSDKYHVPQ